MPIFGTRPDGIYCPLRQLGTRGVQTYEVALASILTIASNYYQQKTGTIDMGVSTRQNHTHRLLSHVIQDPNQDIDAVLAAIIFTQLVEFALGRTRSVENSMKCLGAILAQRGGMSNIPKLQPKLVDPFYVSVQYMFAEYKFSSEIEQQVTRTNFLSSLHSVLANFGHICTTTPPPGSDNSDLPEFFVDSKLTCRYYQSLTTARKKLWEILNKFTNAVTVSDHSVPYVVQSGTFLVLLHLSHTLVPLESSISKFESFVSRLEEVCEGSFSTSPEAQMCVLRSTTLGSIISHVRQEFSPPESRLEQEARVNQIIIDGLKVFGGADNRKRTLLLHHLHARLFTGNSDGGDIWLNKSKQWSLARE
ncbi:uncharacterized protein Z519_09165 [Cladophialophora bantiana CBS 173.52]|uniref:Uncharacterized protein n=1 Tax=Cladophialophora bantiana (strain ATCC 10958 / CBS 173.52 / CDC B-1940 / NIH 8579) TaxID=1442370 RepID=A0A0D2HBD9_CLAB1|nr:uncharacterized protein Z519_09165 [Cladophialophora bantiana CBS 173.52]KIW90518.1 hypothetical protein Z519_09165 [Cladophialophora bantiana CBS 173.52]